MVFAICIEFTFCRTEYLHSCNYTSHFFLFLNSKKIHFIAFLRTYYVHFFRPSLRNEITVLAFVQVKCCMHRMKKRLHQVQVCIKIYTEHQLWGEQRSWKSGKIFRFRLFSLCAEPKEAKTNNRAREWYQASENFNSNRHNSRATTDDDCNLLSLGFLFFSGFVFGTRA